MTVIIIQLLIDFGLAILIWMIQRVVYLSFLHYSNENLIVWHRKYTSSFSPIVIPLMFGQLGISIYQVALSTNSYTVLNLLIIIILWLSTFLQFLPIHSNISKGKTSKKMLKSLVAKNWSRTILWSLLFLMNYILLFHDK